MWATTVVRVGKRASRAAIGSGPVWAAATGAGPGGTPPRVRGRVVGRDPADLQVDLEDGGPGVQGPADVVQHAGLGVEGGRRDAAGGLAGGTPRPAVPGFRHGRAGG